MSDHIELAKKLHRLVISSNVNEAITAAAKLSGLVSAHDIRLSDLDVDAMPREPQQIIYRDRVVEVEKIVYRDRVVEKIVKEFVYQEIRPLTDNDRDGPELVQPSTRLNERHYNMGDDMECCLQLCSCGEWFTDANFYRHMDTVHYAQRHAR